VADNINRNYSKQLPNICIPDLIRTVYYFLLLGNLFSLKKTLLFKVWGLFPLLAVQIWIFFGLRYFLAKFLPFPEKSSPVNLKMTKSCFSLYDVRDRRVMWCHTQIKEEAWILHVATMRAVACFAPNFRLNKKIEPYLTHSAKIKKLPPAKTNSLN